MNMDNKIDLEVTDEGLEEIDKAFENYMKYLEVQEDGVSTATDLKMQNENKHDIDHDLGIISQSSSIKKPAKKTSRRNSLSSASVLTDINEVEEEVKSWVKAAKPDESIAWPKIFAFSLLCFTAGLLCVLIPVSYKTSRLLGKSLVYLSNDNIPSFKYKLDKLLLDNKHDKKRETPVFYELKEHSGTLIQDTYSSCFRYLTTASEVFSNNSIITANSLCDFVDQYESSNNKILASHVRLYIILRNPMVRIVLSYLKQIDPKSKYFESAVVGMTFEEFLDSDFVEHNLLARSLLCKIADEELTQDDLQYAKHFISYKCQVKLYYNQGYEKALSDIKNIIMGQKNIVKRDTMIINDIRRGTSMLSTEDNLMNCVLNDVSENWVRYSPIIVEKFVLKYANIISERNSYDVELYSLALDLYSSGSTQ